jgi:hypothetical protein
MLVNSLPSVRHFQFNFFRCSNQFHRCSRTSGMAMYIGQAFLDDAKQGKLIILREAAHIGRQLKGHFYLCCVPRIPPHTTSGLKEVPVAYLTAQIALTLAGFQPGKTVLAPAIGGSVGNAVTQLARTQGAKHAISSTTNHAKTKQAKALGFGEVIDTSCAEPTRSALTRTPRSESTAHSWNDRLRDAEHGVLSPTQE